MFHKIIQTMTSPIVSGSAMGGRTWSKASLPDSVSQAMRPKTMSPMPFVGKTIVVRAWIYCI